MDRELPERHAAWYGAPIAEFLSTSAKDVLGSLTGEGKFDLVREQVDAWIEEIDVLRRELRGMPSWIYLEFDIPRLGTRIDAVAIAGAAVIPIEFKVGEREFKRGDLDQVWDYGLDLKNFHAASHGADIFPILVATQAGTGEEGWNAPHADGVRPPCRATVESLGRLLHRARKEASGKVIDGREWGLAPYRPTPTIVQAARLLYRGHAVSAISRSDAGAKNLSVTSARVEAIIDAARAGGTKEVVFVTGVPGAGKTLVGMNVATRRGKKDDPTHAVYLSGNGPLVAVLQEALTRDEFDRRRRKGTKGRKGTKWRKGEVLQEVKAFIQIVHHFRDEGLRDSAGAPDERVVIFDEAQRAWDRKKTASFMKTKKQRPGFTLSEPDVLLSYMDRHDGWAVVICLVGGGQEINTGESGIREWLEVVREKFKHWRVHVSPNLSDAEFDAVDAVRALAVKGRVQREPDLHLSASMRSFRAESLSEFVKAALDSDVAKARSLMAKLRARYPIVVTRDLELAKRWVCESARGSEQYGLVASSHGHRLKPHAIDVRVKISPKHWFLFPRDDTRSSYYLEDAATEFDIQGLELDWTCVTWDADLRRVGNEWSYHSFCGSGWDQIHKTERRRYLINAYRVLLTRARQGMAIFVPPGDIGDPTRSPAYYDDTYRYLTSLGIPPAA